MTAVRPEAAAPGGPAEPDLVRGWFPIDAERHRRDAPKYCPSCAAALSLAHGGQGLTTEYWTGTDRLFVCCCDGHELSVKGKRPCRQRRGLFERVVLRFDRIHLRAQPGLRLLPRLGGDIAARVEFIRASQHLPVCLRVVLGGPGDSLPAFQHRHHAG